LKIPPAFGTSWDDFVTNWCLGVAPATNQTETVLALDALVRLLPEYVARVINQPSRGLGVIAPAIDVGVTLAACESLPGFSALLPRIRQGESSAFSEASYAAALKRTGCAPELEPVSGSGLLDTAVEWRGTPIYSEVISPERAETIIKVQNDVHALANDIRDLLALTGSTLEVLLETDLTPETHAAVLNAAAGLPVNQETRIDGLATFIRRPSSIPLQLGPTIVSKGDTPVIAAAAGKLDAGVGTGGIVRMPILDGRARRLLAGELHHFSQEHHNILAIDITRVPVGPKNWAPLIKRSFQPGQNRRIGAVIFFSRGLVGTPITTRQQWAVVANPYAYRPVPADFLQLVASLDESAHFRGQPGPDPNTQ
jgi:hypothetical protein